MDDSFHPASTDPQAIERATTAPGPSGIATIDQLLRRIGALGGIAMPARLVPAPQSLLEEGQSAGLLLTVEADEDIELYETEHTLSREAFAMIGLPVPIDNKWRDNNNCRCCHEFVHNNHADQCPFADHLHDH